MVVCINMALFTVYFRPGYIKGKKFYAEVPKCFDLCGWIFKNTATDVINPEISKKKSWSAKSKMLSAQEHNPGQQDARVAGFNCRVICPKKVCWMSVIQWKLSPGDSKNLEKQMNSPGPVVKNHPPASGKRSGTFPRHQM